VIPLKKGDDELSLGLTREQGGGRKEQDQSPLLEMKDDDTFENLEVWQEAVELAALVYENFRNCRDFGFRGQIQEAAVSVSNNIAEGYERSSNAEFIRFLDIARGSCGEVRSQTYVAIRVQLLSDEKGKGQISHAKRLSKRIARLMVVRRKDFG
jgi:four helix bundle protein